MAKELKQLTKRAENYSQWYNDLVTKADLAEQSPVRGCMIIKPYGYAIWEKTLIFHYLYQSLFFQEKLNMLKDSQKNVLS